VALRRFQYSTVILSASEGSGRGAGGSAPPRSHGRGEIAPPLHPDPSLTLRM